MTIADLRRKALKGHPKCSVRAHVRNISESPEIMEN